MKKESTEKIVSALLVASFFSLTLFFFAPAQIYFTNSVEFMFSFSEIYYYLIAISFISLLLLMLFLLPLEYAMFQRTIAVLFVFSALAWIQGNLMLWDYGLIDGKNIDWNKYFWRWIIDAYLWLVIISVALIKPKALYKHARKASIIFILIQSITIIFLAWRSSESPSFKRYSIDETNKFAFSSKKNVIILVLDAFQAGIFQEIINEDSYYKDIFDGFTYFRNSLGGYVATYLSVPLILTGQYYDNSIPVQEFIKRTFSSNSLPKFLKDKGFEIGLFPYTPQTIYYSEKIAFNMKRKKNTKPSSENLAYLYDIAFFRYSPHFMKKYIYNSQSWFFTRVFSYSIFGMPKKELTLRKSREKKISEAKDARPVSTDQSGYEGELPEELKFLIKQLAQGGLGFEKKVRKDNNMRFFEGVLLKTKVGTDKAVFKFYHIKGPHEPIRCNELLEYMELPENDRENYKDAAKASLKITKIFLDRLKQMRIYDNSLIFIIADHGKLWNFSIPEDLALNEEEKGRGLMKSDGRALPLILVKPFNARGQMKISDAPVTLGDVPKTVTSELGMKASFIGVSMFEVQESDVRERRFFVGPWRTSFFERKFFPALTEYKVTGFSWLKSSWKKTGRIFSPPQK